MVGDRHQEFRDELESLVGQLLASLGDLGRRRAALDELLQWLDRASASAVAAAARPLGGVSAWHWKPPQPTSAGWRGRLLGHVETPQLPDERELMAEDPRFAWIFLFHHDGFIREPALLALPGPPSSPFFLAALALRLNDWVPVIRETAARVSHRLLPMTDLGVLVAAASYLLERRVAWARWMDEAEVLDEAFARQELGDALADQIATSTTGPMARTLVRMLRYRNLDPHLERLAFDALQPSVRAVALKVLIEGRAQWQVGFTWRWIDKASGVRRREPEMAGRELADRGDPADYIRRGLADPSALVRRVAVSALIARCETMADAGTLALRLVRDRSPPVRTRAEFLLRHLGVSKA